MDFTLSPEQLALQRMARDFAAVSIAPFAAEWDRNGHFPLDCFKQGAALGFGNVFIPEAMGGSGLGRLDGAILFESLATACVSTAAYFTVHNMVAWIIATYAKPEMAQKHLPRMHTMQDLGSYCLTEPNAGSDAASLTTKAEDKGDHYLINGTKSFITAGGVSEIYIVMARTGGAGASGISAFLLDKSMSGISFGAPEHKMGWRNQPTVVVNFDNVRVPKTNLLGQIGDGFKIAMRALDGGRVNIAATSLGGAQTALSLADEYARSRQQFGKALRDFQATQFKIATMATQFHAARLMTYRAAAALDANDPQVTMLCAMAKKIASETAFAIADEALQLHGGYGYLADYPIERFFRDLRVNRILEGTNEVMNIIIAREFNPTAL
jgi:alkylation response protein AidB-like acyl-CoA dehydrogenase